MKLVTIEITITRKKKTMSPLDIGLDHQIPTLPLKLDNININPDSAPLVLLQPLKTIKEAFRLPLHLFKERPDTMLPEFLNIKSSSFKSLTVKSLILKTVNAIMLLSKINLDIFRNNTKLFKLRNHKLSTNLFQELVRTEMKLIDLLESSINWRAKTTQLKMSKLDLSIK